MESPEKKSPKEPGKSFTEYFFEFFMLFLAVFCGFLAENYRERLSEHELEKQYMITLIEDLKADTAEFARLKVMCENVMSRSDSVVKYLRPPIAKDKIEQYYIELVWVTSMNSFSYNDRTTEQLKSSGAFRLIRNNKVADSIVVYDNKMRGVFTKNYNVLWNHRIKLIAMCEEVYDLSAIGYMRHDFATKQVTIDARYKDDKFCYLQLITDDRQKLMEVYNAAKDQTYFAYDFSNWVRRMNTKAVGLMQLIQKEYDIK